MTIVMENAPKLPPQPAVPPIDPWIEILRYASAALHLWVGTTFLIGPGRWLTSPAFAVTAKFPGGLRVWGAVFLALGVAMTVGLVGRHFRLVRWCLIVGCGMTAAWALSFVYLMAVSLVIPGHHGIDSPTGPPFWGFFALAQFVQAGRVGRNR